MLAPERLDAAFKAIKPFFQESPRSSVKPDISAQKIESAFGELRSPLAAAKQNGGLINPWDIVGLKRGEVRNTAALRGLWQTDFGGEASRQFLAEYLSSSIPGYNWPSELQARYSVDTEISPVGDTSDRVDLVIETARHLIGIEVKIDAGLGPKQLERYIVSIERRAEMHGLKSHVILLAPFESRTPEVISTSWRDIATAASRAARGPAGERNFIEHFIATFGAHVSHF